MPSPIRNFLPLPFKTQLYPLMTYLNEICSTWNKDLFFAAFLWLFLETGFMWKFCNRLSWLLDGRAEKACWDLETVGRFLILVHGKSRQILVAKVDYSLLTLLFIIWLIICITLLFCYLLTYICRRYTNMFWIHIATKPQSHRHDTKKLF
jgi:hypothetical protein